MLGVCGSGLMRCLANGSGFTNICEPTTAGGPETCGDGIDQNCDGTPDDGCTCTVGATQSCFTPFQGACSGGLQTCRSTPSGATEFGPCVQQVQPSPDTCGDGIDQDCDGTPDDGCGFVGSPAVDDDGDGFDENQGDCDDGNPLVFPGNAESCDQFDNNCVSGNNEGCSAVDADNDGRSPAQGDCNDASSAVGPQVSEGCSTTNDLDCNGFFGDPAACLGTVTSSFAGGNMTVVVNAPVTTNLVGPSCVCSDGISRVLTPAQIQFLEFGSDAAGCGFIDPNTTCGQTPFLGDNVDHTLTNVRASFTPRAKGTAGGATCICYLDLKPLDDVDVSAADGFQCLIGPDAGNTGLKGNVVVQP
jgi:hypothetical protein